MLDILKGLSTRLHKTYNALRDDSLVLDLVPALGSRGTFFVSRGDDGTGDVLIAGNVILTFPEPIRFDRLSISLIGSTSITDLVEKHTDTTTHLSETLVLSEHKSLYPSDLGSADPHVEDFQFLVPAHKALSLDIMPPSLHLVNKKYTVDIKYRLEVEATRVLPDEINVKKSMDLVWCPIAEPSGLDALSEITEQHADVTFDLSVPKTIIAGKSMPYTFRFVSSADSEDIALNVPLPSSDSLPRRSVFVPRVKESHVYLIETISLIPSDAHFQPLWTPVSRKFVISTLVGDAVTNGWGEAVHRNTKIPKWSVCVNNDDDDVPIATSALISAGGTLLRNRQAAQPTVVVDDPESLITDKSGINPSGVFCGGKIKVEHVIQSVVVFHDAKIKTSEVAINVVVENPQFWDVPSDHVVPPWSQMPQYDTVQITGESGLTEDEELAIALEQSRMESENANKVAGSSTKETENPFAKEPENPFKDQ